MVQDLLTRATPARATLARATLARATLVGKGVPLSVVMGGWTLCESPRQPNTPEVLAAQSRRTGEFLAKIEPGPEGKHWTVQLSEEDVMPWGSLTDETRPTNQCGRAVSVASSDPWVRPAEAREERQLMTVLREELETRYGPLEELHVLFQPMPGLPRSLSSRLTDSLGRLTRRRVRREGWSPPGRERSRRPAAAMVQ